MKIKQNGFSPWDHNMIVSRSLFSCSTVRLLCRCTGWMRCVWTHWGLCGGWAAFRQLQQLYTSPLAPLFHRRASVASLPAACGDVINEVVSSQAVSVSRSRIKGHLPPLYTASPQPPVWWRSFHPVTTGRAARPGRSDLPLTISAGTMVLYWEEQ